MFVVLGIEPQASHEAGRCFSMLPEQIKTVHFKNSLLDWMGVAHFFNPSTQEAEAGGFL